MGSCVFKGIISTSEGTVWDDNKMVKVMTSNGGIMELSTPITAECITSEFSGHGIFRSRRDLLSEALHDHEELHPGELYHLLPLDRFTRQVSNGGGSATLTPYRMCTYENKNNNNNNNRVWSEAGEVVPRKGVWKVKLVISPEQLSEILSQESRTEAFVESLRTVAKCGSGVPPVACSDHWSVSTTLNGPVTQNHG